MTGIQNVQQGLESFWDWAADDRPRIGVGLDHVDKVMRGGLAKAECMMVMAYSSVGKTWLALNTIVNNPLVPTLFCSLEMSWRQVAARLTAINSGVPTWEMETEIRNGRRPGVFYDTVRQYPLLLCNDSSEQTIKDISSSVRQGSEMLGQPIRLVMIDYLELIGGSGLLGKSEQVDRASQKIRSVAKDNDCSVIVVHQVGKSDGSGGFEPLDLDSGRYGGHAPMDCVLGLYSPAMNKALSSTERDRVASDLYVQVLKNRNGAKAPDGVRHTLNPNTGRITRYGQTTSLPGMGFQPALEHINEYVNDDRMERVFG